MYGLRIRSQWPLPCPAVAESEVEELELFEGPASLFEYASEEAASRLSVTEWVRHAHLRDGADYVHWPELFEFVISTNGRRIAGRFFSKASQEAFQTYLLGQVISYAMVKQGLEPLHATVVAIDGKTVALLGNSGYGKSSLAAAFLQAGARLLTDDLLVLRENGKGWLAYPGPARIKLFPEVAQTFLRAESRGVPMNPFYKKLVIPLEVGQSVETAMPLEAAFVLPPPRGRTRSHRVAIRKRRQRQACIDLIASTFNSVIKNPSRLAQQFGLAARLATTIPVKSLSYSRGLSHLRDVVAAIRADLAR